MKNLESIMGKNDSKVCQALIENGALKIAEIEKRTGTHRRNIYDSIARLTKDGYASSYVKNNKQYFEVTDIEKILERLKEKSEEIEEAINGLSRAKEKSGKPEIRIYEGDEGVKLLLDDEIRVGKTVCALVTASFERDLWNYLEKNFHPTLKGEVKVRLVYTESDRDLAERGKKFPFVKIRVVPDSYRSAVGLEIYGDRACIITGEMMVRIKDKEVAKRFMMFFEEMWRIGKPI